MKTIKKVDVRPEYVELMPEKLEPNVIYISHEYKVAVHLCLCGCGVKTITPLVRNGWILETYKDGTIISLQPSIANYQFPCKSHYIITKNVANFV